MQQWLLIGLAGAAGALTRFSLAGLVQRVLGSGFPWGTASVNVLGSLLFGIVWSLAEERLAISPAARTIILTGFMGAFTTFSTFMFETSTLMRDSQWLFAAANLIGQVALGLICMFIGLAIGRLL